MAHGNSIQVSGDGSTVIGNDVTGATLEDPTWTGTAILVTAADGAVVRNNYVHDAQLGIGVVGLETWGGSAIANLIEHNTVQNCVYGISVQMDAQNTVIRYNNVLNNGLGQPDGSGIESQAVDLDGFTGTVTPSGTEIHFNNIVGNEPYGVVSFVFGNKTSSVLAEEVDATLNWWGDPSGSHNLTTNPSATGDNVSDYVDYTPWLDASYPGGNERSWNVQIVDGKNFNSIQAAIDNASLGETLLVHPGTYTATSLASIVITKPLTLAGTDRDTCIIDGGDWGSSGEGWPKGIHSYADNVVIENFTIRGFTGDNVETGGYGVLFRNYDNDDQEEGYIFYQNCTLRNVRVENCYSPIYALCHQHLTVENCIVENAVADGMFIARYSSNATIIGNSVTNAGDQGIWVGCCWKGLGPSDNATIINNTINGAREGGITFCKSSGALISGNSVTNVKGEEPPAGWSVGAISLKDGTSNVTVSNNEIFANDGLGTGSGRGIGIDGNSSDITITGNTIRNNAGGGIKIMGSASDVTVQGNTFENNSVQVQDNAEVLNILDVAENNTFDRAVIVETTSYLPFIWSSIQEAIDNASSGDTVIVAAGIYEEEIKIMDKSLTLLGAQADVPIVNGERAGDESVISGTLTSWPYKRYCVVRIQHSDVAINGFTIEGAKQWNIGIQGLGEGISNILISYNYIEDSGYDGIFRANSVADVTITHNYIASNRRGILTNGGATTITNNTFYGNGRGIDLQGGDPYSVYFPDYAGPKYPTIISGNAFTNDSTSIALRLDRCHQSITITGNDITEARSAAIKTWNVYDENIVNPAIHNNNIWNNEFGINNQVAGINLDATLNWWGSENGPSTSLNTFNIGQQGDNVSANVDFTPWLDAAYPDGKPFAPVVNENTGDNFSSIQDAIDNASAGDTVLVYSGTYKEHIVIDKSNLSLIGEDKETTIIDATQGPSWAVAKPGILIGEYPLVGGVHGVTVSGFTIQDAAMQEGGVPYAGEKYGVGPQALAGILIYNSDNNTIENNILINNYWQIFVCAEWPTAGYTSCRNNRIANNIITDSEQDGVYLYSDGGVFVEDTEIVNNEINNAYGDTASGVEFWGWPEGGDTPTISGTVIRNNDITNCTYGVRIREDVSDITGTSVNYNDIAGNEEYGVLNITKDKIDATYNWWGHLRGPRRGKGGSERGDRVSKKVRYRPWLTKPFQTVLEEHIGHYGSEGPCLEKGWNTFSVPIYLDNNAWEGIAAYLDENIAYRFNASKQKWELMTTDNKLDPLDAIYIRMNSEDSVPLVVSVSPRRPPVKELKRGWNLVGLAVWEEENMSVDRALVEIELTPDGRGYTIVVSPPLNQESWAYTIGQTKKQLMRKNEAYWVYMENPDNLPGFSSTPLSFWEPE